MTEQEINILQRRLAREQIARKEAEVTLEQKAKELFEKNSQLQSLNVRLENIVAARTAELEVNQMRLSQLITNLQHGVLVEDQNHKLILTNQVFCNTFLLGNWSPDWVGVDTSTIFEKVSAFFVDKKGFLKYFQKLRDRREIVLNKQLKLIDGTILEIDYIPVFTAEFYLGQFWKFRNVTKQIVAEERLRESEDKYRGIIENMELGLLEVDTNGIIVKAYPRFCAMVGYSHEELVGKPAASTLLPPEYLPTLEKQSQDRLQGKGGVYEVELIKKGGDRLWALISGAPIADIDGNVIGSIGIHYDITIQKKLQLDLEEAKKAAEIAQDSERQFLANMSHEMRTPLNAIVGMSHLLYDTHPTEEQKEYLSLLRSASDILQGVVSDILDLSKIRSGELEVQQKEFDLAGLVRTLHRSFQLRIEDKPIKLLCEIDEQIDTLLIGDDLLLNQILINLLSNAIKFTAQGQISIRVELIEAVDGFSTVQLTVSDTGIGIPQNKQQLIFQTFKQVDGDIKRKFGGTGLGLAITKQIVEIQNGTIRVSSKLGKGSRFTVELKYKDTGRKTTAGIGEFTKTPLSKMQHAGKMLIVEDNLMNRKYISSLLNKWQIPFDVAFNGREGLEKALQEAYDIIFMDIQMPEMDGYETTIAIRNQENPNKHTPIVALTASAMLSNKDKAFEAGMTNYLSKPFSPTQMYDKIQEILQDSEEHLSTRPIKQSSLSTTTISEEVILEMYEGDEDYAKEMFELFLIDIFPQYDVLLDCSIKNEWDKLAKLAHKLKSGTHMVGLTCIVEQLEEIEVLVFSQTIDNDLLHHLVKTLHKEVHLALPAVQQRLKLFKTTQQ